MRLFGNMGGCGGHKTNDCCDIFILLWLLNSCGCGCGFNFDCDTLIILILLMNCCGGCHDDCR